MYIFVFGSNLAGRHGAGSAYAAYKKHGAVYGQGVGRQGSSYAIPTKDRQLRVLALEDIAPYVTEFLEHAKNNPQDQFHVVSIGCGLAGYFPEEIAPLFVGKPDNVHLTPEFDRVIAARN